MPFIENWVEFKTRMGCKYVTIVRGDGTPLHRFENGGVSDREYHWDPPSDPNELLGMQREYHKVMLQDRETKFYKLRESLNEQANLVRRLGSRVPQVEQESMDELADLRDQVMHERKTLNEIEAKLAEAHPDGGSGEYRAKQDAAAVQQANEAIRQMAEMDI